MTKILVVDDDEQMQRALSATLTRSGYEVALASNGKDALSLIDTQSFDLVISDQMMPEMSGLELLQSLEERSTRPPAIMITAYGTISQAVEAMQRGAADFIAKPFSGEDLLRVVEKVLQQSSVVSPKSQRRTSKNRPIITADPMMIRLLEVAEAIARSNATVLVQGESGTGKELIARLIHTSSPRHAQPFVAVNCAALPETLLESELFGHEKGSFTGALQRKIGKFELAHGGTILLDEISEMELPLQAKLLRVLQEREVDRVGGREPISIDVRVVATTNRNLEDMVREGKFRGDLYYRLNVIPLVVPPLRKRPADIKLLVEHFMRQNLGKDTPKLSQEVVHTLEEYTWPGNVRELQNSVERAAILSQGNTPRQEDFLLPQSVSSAQAELPRPQISNLDLSSNAGGTPGLPPIEVIVEDDILPQTRIEAGTKVEDMERELIMVTLRSTNNNRTRAADLLGISPRTLRNKLHEYREKGILVPGE